MLNKREILDFFLAAVFFLITQTLAHLSTNLYTFLRSSNDTASHLATFLINFFIAIFILSLNSEFLSCNTADLLIAFFADLMIGIFDLLLRLKLYFSEGGTRTHDPMVNSHLLYQLSYLGMAYIVYYPNKSEM